MQDIVDAQKFFKIISKHVDADDSIKKIDFRVIDPADNYPLSKITVIMKSKRYFRLLNNGTVEMKLCWNSSKVNDIGKI